MLFRLVRRLLLSAVLLLYAGSAVANGLVSLSAEGFKAAIKRETPAFAPPSGVTGITVPHHLLAADLIARGFWAASGGTYDRILLLGPDHFRRIKGAFATTTEVMSGPWGEVQVDAAVEDLVRTPDFEPLDDIAQDHSIGALLPFVQHFFEGVPVLPVLAAVRSTPEEWENAILALEPLITDRTLIVQSTDYSHFLTAGNAVLRDQEVLNTLATGDPQHVLGLTQPDHMDSRAAHYMQMRLQQMRSSISAVLANRNSTFYAGNPDEVTSYLTLAWHKDAGALSAFVYPDQSRTWVGGDVLLARAVEPVLADAEALGAILQTTQTITQYGPLIINLEGAMAGGPVANLPLTAHLMQSATALPTLKGLGVVGAGLANNHSWDFGESVAKGTAEYLRRVGIAALDTNRLHDFGSFRMIAVNMLPGRDPYQTPETLRGLLCGTKARPPLIALVHWGAEYTNQATREEHAVADILSACGVGLILGSHSHQASDRINISPGGMPFVFSLGNFLFDQSAHRASSALAEIRIFEQGTLAVRLVPFPNLFEVGRKALSE